MYYNTCTRFLMQARHFGAQVKKRRVISIILPFFGFVKQTNLKTTYFCQSRNICGCNNCYKNSNTNRQELFRSSTEIIIRLFLLQNINIYPIFPSTSVQDHKRLTNLYELTHLLNFFHIKHLRNLNAYGYAYIYFKTHII